MGVKPLALRKRVKLRRDCRKYNKAFRTLSGQRQFNQGGVQSIPISEIVAYLDGIGVHRAVQREVFIDHMTEMDAVFMEYLRKQMDRKK